MSEKILKEDELLDQDQNLDSNAETDSNQQESELDTENQEQDSNLDSGNQENQDGDENNENEEIPEEHENESGSENENKPNEEEEWLKEEMEKQEEERRKQQEIICQEASLREMMLKSQQSVFLVDLPDVEAIKIPLCYPSWNSFIGSSLKKGERIEYEGKLYKVKQDLSQVQEHQPPSIHTAALYEVINEQNQGTLEDPIPYDKNMEVFKDKYYLENGKIYKCIRDSGQPLYANCESLVNIYFELIK